MPVLKNGARIAAVALVATGVVFAATAATATAALVRETGVRTYAPGGLQGDLSKYPEAKSIDLTKATGYRAGNTLVFTLTAKKVKPFATERFNPFSGETPPTYQSWCVEVWNPKLPRMQTFCAGHGTADEWFNATGDGAAYDSTCVHGGTRWTAKANPTTDKVRLIIPLSCFPRTGTWQFNARSQYYPGYLGGPTVSDYGNLARDWTKFANTAAH